MPRTRRPLIALLLLALATAGVGFSGASFTSRTDNPGTTISSASDLTPPTVTAGNPGSPLRGTVTLTATATDAASGVAAVELQIAPAGTTAWSSVCTDGTAPFSCALDTTSKDDGAHDLRAIAVDVAGNRATSATVGARVIDNRGPLVALDPPGDLVRGTVRLTATASDAGTGVASVRIQRAPADSGTWTDVCTAPAPGHACDWNTAGLTEDAWDLRAVATDAAGNLTVSSLVTTLVDNTAPTVAVTDPGSPLRGVVTVEATSADAASGVASVRIQRALAGTGQWTDLCTDTATPWSCRWDTTTEPLGLYDLRAIATDRAGNARTSTTVANRRVDNTTASVTLDNPGDLVRGTVTLAATVSSTTGASQVLFQRAPAGSTTWTTICTDTAAPWQCAWNTTTVADGLHDLRAVMTTGSGQTVVSPTVAGRRVDNTPVRGTDVQAANGGATPGRFETGDTLTLTWNEVLRPATLVPGWSGTGTAALSVRVRDGAVTGAAGTEDTLQLLTDGGAATGLGSVALGGDYVRDKKTVIFAATATYATPASGGTTVTITLGATAGGPLRTLTTAATLVWTPSATATDAAGNPTSTAPVAESGAADRDL